MPAKGRSIFVSRESLLEAYKIDNIFQSITLHVPPAFQSINLINEITTFPGQKIRGLPALRAANHSIHGRVRRMFNKCDRTPEILQEGLVV